MLITSLHKSFVALSRGKALKTDSTQPALLSSQLEPGEVNKVEHLAAKEPRVHSSDGMKLDELMVSLFCSQSDFILQLHGLC